MKELYYQSALQVEAIVIMPEETNVLKLTMNGTVNPGIKPRYANYINRGR